MNFSKFSRLRLLKAANFSNFPYNPKHMKSHTVFISILVSVCACTAKQEVKDATAIDASKTKEVLEHHWQTFRENDLDGVMEDYTEESILITPDRTYKGLAEIRENFVNAFAFFPTDSTTMTLTKSVVSGDVAYILWSAKTPGFELSYATDTFIIQNGKIIRQTYAGK
jgi:hypothetical protein